MQEGRGSGSEYGCIWGLSPSPSHTFSFCLCVHVNDSLQSCACVSADPAHVRLFFCRAWLIASGVKSNSTHPPTQYPLYNYSKYTPHMYIREATHPQARQGRMLYFYLLKRCRRDVHVWWRWWSDSFIQAVRKHQGAAQHARSRGWCMMCSVNTFLSGMRNVLWQNRSVCVCIFVASQ